MADAPVLGGWVARVPRVRRVLDIDAVPMMVHPWVVPGAMTRTETAEVSSAVVGTRDDGVVQVVASTSRHGAGAALAAEPVRCWPPVIASPYADPRTRHGCSKRRSVPCP